MSEDSLRQRMAGDSLMRLYDSQGELYERFDFSPNIQDCFAILREEFDEFVKAAWIAHWSTQNTKQNRLNVADEFADLVVTAIGLANAAGLGYEALAEACERVARKNDAKTELTHAVLPDNTGRLKIRRIQPNLRDIVDEDPRGWDE